MVSEPKVDTAGDLASPTLKGVRIIFIIGTFTLGGAERQALLLARHLIHQQGADVEFWGVGPSGRVSELCDDYDIPWRSAPIHMPWEAPPRLRLKRFVDLTLTLRRARPDVILPFMFFQSVACGIVWPFTGARWCIWNQRCEGRDRVARFYEKLAIWLTPCVVANSGLGVEFMVKKLGAKRVNLVYNGVQLRPREWDKKRWREHLGVSDDSFVACMVANLHEFKDHPTLLKAWRIVMDRLGKMNRPAVLLLAGAFFGSEKRVKALAYDLKLGKSVRFLGGVRDISGLLSAVDLAVHSSVNEGVPNGVLEPMAAGVAVTGTDYPGIREALGEQGYKFLAPPFDAEALAEQIITFALNPQLRRDAGIANSLRIETEFPPHKMHQKMVSLILEGLRKRRLAPITPRAMAERDPDKR